MQLNDILVFDVAHDAHLVKDAFFALIGAGEVTLNCSSMKALLNALTAYCCLLVLHWAR